MTTLNRTFSVKNGIDVANTIIVDSNRNLSNIVTANTTTINSTNFITSAGLNVTDQANNAYAAANSAANTVRVSANAGSTLSQKQLNFNNTVSIQVTVSDSGDGNANISFVTTGAAVADAYAQANAAYNQANTARTTANDAYAQANTSYLPSVTRLDVTNSGTTAYRFDQYGAAVNNPTLYIRGGETLAFNLNNAGHPFAIRVSSGGSNYDTGLTHVSTAGVVTTGSSAQGKTSGTLYWKVPYELIGNTYVYQCTAHGGMVGNIVIEPPMVVAYAQANAAYGQANAAYLQANNAYAEANLKLNLTGGTITGNLNVNNYIYANAFYSTNKNVVGPNLANTHGERLRLYDFEQAGHPNYAIGVEPNHIWVGTDENNGGTGFKWYGNTTQVAVMRSNGTLQLSNTVEAKVIKANGTGTAIDASQGNILTNQVTGTQFNFLNGSYTVSVNGGGATANYTLSLPANTGLSGQALTTDGTGNLTWSSAALDTANGAYAQANGAYAQANGAFAQANGAYAQANGAYAQANGAYAQANGAYGQANIKVGSIVVSGNGLAVSNATSSNNNQYTLSVNTASTTDRGTTILVDSTSSTDTGNAATANAVNATFNYAATKLPLTGGTVSGDLTVQGNLFLTGNATYINVATLKVNDSIIQLSTNSTSDAVDIGFVGHYSEDGGITNLHSGFIRHASDNVFYIFDGYASEPTNNIIDIASANLAWLRANVNAASLLLEGNTVATQANLTIAHNQANAAYNQANAAYGDANTRVLKAGDTMTGGLTITTSGIGLSVANANVTFSLQVGTLNVTSNTVTTSSSGQVVLDKFPATQLASAKYFVQAKSGSDYHTTEVVLVQDATNVWITEYGSIQSGPSLGSFSADISSGDVRLLFNANNNVNTIRSVRYGIIP